MVLDLEEAVVQATLADLINNLCLDCWIRRVKLYVGRIQSAIMDKITLIAKSGLHTGEVNKGDLVRHLVTIGGINAARDSITRNSWLQSMRAMASR